MSNQHHEDTVKSESVTPMGDQQQATQQQTHEAMKSAKDQGEKVVDEAQAKGNQIADRATDQAERQKERAADRMENVADKMRDRGSDLPGGQRTQQATDMAANKMDQAASFLHDRNAGEMLDKVRDMTRSHPAPALVVAAAVGLFLGRKLFS